MKLFIVLLALLGAVATHPSIPPHLAAKWTSFKADHGKNYASHVESARAKAFAENVRFIEKHNEKFARGEVTYELGLNAYSDMTSEEFGKAHLNCFVSGDHLAANISKHVTMPGAVQYIDWRTKGAVSSVKDQADCGACYAFATVGLIESYLMRNGEHEIDLSEQDVIDCTYKTHPYGYNFGCGGGDSFFTLEEAGKKGLALEIDYSYTSGTTDAHGECRKDARRKDLSKLVPRFIGSSEEDFVNAIQNGPILVSLNAKDIQQYKSGIYDNTACDTETNHTVLIVGYGKEGDKEYWIVKNSWGASWGEDGYIRIAKGFNRCGIKAQGGFTL